MVTGYIKYLLPTNLTTHLQCNIAVYSWKVARIGKCDMCVLNKKTTKEGSTCHSWMQAGGSKLSCHLKIQGGSWKLLL